VGPPIANRRPSGANRRLRRAQEWARRVIESDHSLWMIFVASFLETIIVPIPIELVLVPYMLIRRDILWRIALSTTLGCLVASGVGYGIGYFLYESIGTNLIEALDIGFEFDRFRVLFDQHGFFAILAIGIMPIPFQAAMLVAGVAGYSIWLFILAATIARGIRYYGLAVLVWRFGDHAATLYRRHSMAILLALGALVLLLWGLGEMLAHFLPSRSTHGT
jgi:membrane protein YqaA with SNARE-associated domain